MVNNITFILWIIWQIYIIYFISIFAKYIYQKIWWEKHKTAFIGILFILGIIWCILSLVLAFLFLNNLSMVCVINRWAECGSIWWAIFAFFIISPIITIISSIFAFFYSKKWWNFLLQKYNIIFLLLSILSSIVFYAFLIEQRDFIISQKLINEKRTKSLLSNSEDIFVCGLWYKHKSQGSNITESYITESLSVEENKIYSNTSYEDLGQNIKIKKEEVGFIENNRVRWLLYWHISKVKSCINSMWQDPYTKYR